MTVGGKTTFVGRFFEEVGQKVLGGVKARDEIGDIQFPHSPLTAVEFKSSGHRSSYGFRLDLEQLKRCERARLFPYDRVWYALFAYRNGHRRDDTSYTTEMAEHVTSDAVYAYLAQAALWGIIVDISIVSRWRETKPVSRKSILGHLGTQTIDIKCREASILTGKSASAYLANLGLEPARYRRLTGLVTAEIGADSQRHHVALPLAAVLPVCDAASLRRRLGWRGFRLRVEKL